MKTPKWFKKYSVVTDEWSIGKSIIPVLFSFFVIFCLDISAKLISSNTDLGFYGGLGLMIAVGLTTIYVIAATINDVFDSDNDENKI